MTAPPLTVVVPHFGRAEPTLLLLDQLAAQERVDLQVVVVDDASPEPFPDTPHATVVRREKNGGFGRAVNSGVERAEHDLLLVLNSDVEINPSFTADLLSAADEWLPAVVSPRVVDRDGHEAWTGRTFPRARHHVAAWLTPLARFRDRRWAQRAVGYDVRARGVTRRVDWVVGAAMLLPTAAVRSVGGFDERFHMNAEEIDLQRRLGDTGVPSVVLAAPTLVHEGGGSSISTKRRRWLVDGWFRYAAKWDGGVAGLRTGLTLATLVNLLVNAGRRATGRDVRPVATAREELDLVWRRGS